MGVLATALKLASPEYLTTKEWDPIARSRVVYSAALTLLKGAVANVVAPSRNVAVPVAAPLFWPDAADTPAGVISAMIFVPNGILAPFVRLV